jgi:hypothetical protein
MPPFRAQLDEDFPILELSEFALTTKNFTL